MNRSKTALLSGDKTGEIRRFSMLDAKTALFSGDISQVIRRFRRDVQKKNRLITCFPYLRSKAVFVFGPKDESPTPNDQGFWKH